MNEDGIVRRLEELRRCFPEAFVEGKVDFERLREALGDIVEDGPERYTFSWAGRRDALRLLQMPTRATLLPCPEQSIDWDTTQNVFIEGENLETLKLLLQSYSGCVKMIYIDPPYNTGNNFIYRDNYRDSLGTYLQMTGQRDEAGNLLTSNPETSGRYHSAWLTMMYPRLFLARQLLREDGVIFVSIDDHEVHNLRMIMNEVFGEENFVALLPTVMNLKGNQDQFGFAGTHEYTLVFARDKGQAVIGGFSLLDEEEEEWRYDDHGPYKRGANLKATGRNAPRQRRPHLWFPVYVAPDDSIGLERQSTQDVELWPVTDGEEMSWRWSRQRFLRDRHDVIVVRNGGEIALYKKQRPSISDMPSRKPKSFWYKPEYSSGNGTNAVRELFGVKLFDAPPKPPVLIRDLVEIGMGMDDLIVDFFAGSCTTAQAVLELNREDGGNRRFIMVQLPEPTPEGSVAREAGFETIAEIGKERIRRVVARLKEQNQSKLNLPNREMPEDLGFRVYKLVSSNYCS